MYRNEKSDFSDELAKEKALLRHNKQKNPGRKIAPLYPDGIPIKTHELLLKFQNEAQKAEISSQMDIFFMREATANEVLEVMNEAAHNNLITLANFLYGEKNNIEKLLKEFNELPAEADKKKIRKRTKESFRDLGIAEAIIAGGAFLTTYNQYFISPNPDMGKDFRNYMLALFIILGVICSIIFYWEEKKAQRKDKKNLRKQYARKKISLKTLDYFEKIQKIYDLYREIQLEEAVKKSPETRSDNNQPQPEESKDESHNLREKKEKLLMMMEEALDLANPAKRRKKRIDTNILKLQPKHRIATQSSKNDEHTATAETEAAAYEETLNRIRSNLKYLQ